MAPKKDYTPEQMGRAIEAVRKGEKVATAAKKYGVPRVTLLNKVSGKTPVSCTMGPATVLTPDEEMVLVRWLIKLSEKHFPVTKDALLDSVQNIMTKQGRNTPFTNNRPGKKWFQSFLKRHPELVEKTPENLLKGRDQVTEHNIRSWFQEIEEFLINRGLQEVITDPRRVFNTDESAFFLSPKPGRVLAKRGEKHLYNSCGDDKDNLTVLITGNAAGKLAPPMIVFSYERIPSNLAASIPDDWAVGKSESGWMCSNTFYEYMTNVFQPWLVKMEIQTPILFFVDGHKSHLTLHLSNFCSENGIEVIALYPNATHILQPMDLAVFRPLKVAWKKAVIAFKMRNDGKTLKKENFAPVLKIALEGITEECLKNGFRAGGLHPFGPDYIDMTKIRQRKETNKEETNKTNSAQVEFLNYLESEIIKTFTLEKLNLFNKLYFENRKTVEDALPQEDLTLYLIWVKNKSEVTQPSNPLPQHASPSMIESPDVPISVEPMINDNAAVNFIAPSQDAEEPTTPQECKGDHAATSKKQQDTDSKVPTSDALFQEDNVTETQKDDNSEKFPKGHTLSTPPHIEGQDVTNSRKQHDTPNRVLTNHAPLQKKNTQRTEKDALIPDQFISMPGTSSSNYTNITPKKRTIDDDLDIIVPSPFKKALFWPDPDLNKKKNRLKKEKIPSAITSKAWKEYYEKKELQKLKQQLQKEERAKERNEKKALKEKLAEERKNKAPKRKRPVQKIKSSSEESDLEIPYEESDDSSYEIETEYSQERSRNIEKGCYVIVKYEGEYFPGRVENTQKTQHEVSTMVLSTGNSFRWPDKTDKIWYKDDEVIEIINEPVPLNKRGSYKIKEMEKYLPDIYSIA